LDWCLLAVVVEEILMDHRSPCKESMVNGSGLSFDFSEELEHARQHRCCPNGVTTVFDATRFTYAQLENVKNLKFDNAEYGIVQYAVLGVHENVARTVVKFYGPNGASERPSLSHRRLCK
jgi:hypothetical protein